MNKLNKYIGYGGCLVGGLAFFFFVLLPGVVYGIFPQYADRVELFLGNIAKATHLVDIFIIAGPYLLVFLVVGIPLIAFSPLWLGFFRDRHYISRLKMVGVKGMATILDIQDTGITVNNSLYVKVTLEIKNLHSQVEMGVYMSRVNLLRKGDTVEVVYDPSDPKIIMPASRFPTT